MHAMPCKEEEDKSQREYLRGASLKVRISERKNIFVSIRRFITLCYRTSYQYIILMAIKLILVTKIGKMNEKCEVRVNVFHT